MNILMQTEKSLHCKYKGYKDRIAFANYIVKKQVNNPGEERFHYNINK